MPTPCAVCSHPSRGEIDRALATQVVNVAAVARHYGLHHKSMERHRLKHLPTFLPAFAAGADTPGTREVNAEAQRLYALALDALATAQAGVLVQVGKANKETGERTFERLVSPTSIVRAIGEARKALGMISALAAQPRKEQATADSMSKTLDAAMTRALDRFEQRALDVGQRHEVEDAVIVTDTEPSEQGSGAGQAPSTPSRIDSYEVGVGTTDTDEVWVGQTRTESATAGPGAGSGPPALDWIGGDPNPDEPEKTSTNRPVIEGSAPKLPKPEQTRHNSPISDAETAARAAELFLAGLDPKTRAHIADIIEQARINDQMNPERIERPWPGNPGASLEERRAAGWPDPVSPYEATPSEVRRLAIQREEQRAGQGAQVDPGLPPRSRRVGPTAPADPSRRSKQ